MQAHATPPEAVPITSEPGFHWFGYYDKLQFGPHGRYVLGMEVEFEHRSPRPDDTIKVGMVDTDDGNRWIELGETTAWCWQQGCMLQWLPGSGSEIIWNDRQNDQFVSHIMDVHTRQTRTLPLPVYTVSPDARYAVTPDLRRINDTRPGYGYTGIPDPHAGTAAPADSGIHRLDLATGEHELIVSVADIARIPYPHGDLTDCKHYFNHLLWNTDGSRFEFLHRWIAPKGGRATRMLTAAPDGSDVRLVDDCGLTSHFIWRDPDHILAWSRALSKRGDFCLFDVRNRDTRAVGRDAMPQDGHVGYLPGNEWIVNDSYPDADRHRALYLYHVPSDTRIDIGRFMSPRVYDGEWRCDLHPRVSPDGNRLTIDSVHGGNGRQIYIIDIRDIRARL